MYKEVEELEGQVCLTLKKTDHTSTRTQEGKKSSSVLFVSIITHSI